MCLWFVPIHVYLTRKPVSWRRPFGHSGILDFSLDLLAEEEDENDDQASSLDLQLHCLRLVGNACADTDENRARVVRQDGLARIIRHLADDRLAPVAVPVLLNVLMDYDAAQQAASRSGLSRRLVTLMSSASPETPSALLSHVCRVLEMLVSQDGEPEVASPSTVDVLLRLASTLPVEIDDDDDDDDDIVFSLLELAVAYLANQAFQTSLISGPSMSLFIQAFRRMHSLPIAEDPEQAARLKRLSSSLLTTLSELSSNDSFPAHHPPPSPVHQTLLSWIRHPDAPGLQSAACLALGNLSRSDEASVGLVERDAIHLSLIHLLSDPAVGDPQLLHLALSFCRNLAIPLPNKTTLSPLLDPSCVPRILGLDSLPQLQLPAVSVVRLLLLNCQPNVRRLCSSDDSVSAIISLFHRSDAEPTKAEAARCVVALCRALHTSPTAPSQILGSPSALTQAEDTSTSPTSPPSKSSPPTTTTTTNPDDGAQQRSLFYEKHDPSRPLSFLLPQRKWPALRSEAWFVLALMSRSPDGAKVVNAALDPQPATDALVEAITGRPPPPHGEASSPSHEDHHATSSSVIASDLQLGPQQANRPEQPASVAKADRENALVLVTGLLSHGKGGIPEPRLALLRRLVNQGAELVATQRTQK
ncbi:hypothetical protein L249_2608 [Ophiocordyceps polyrhachis-furcata BCC 54312]|uniref:UNC-45/Cro1/She4 central domain-containing protein n=1 Tax=Ophiocordyceps polyrhachis-furcata BCC 54312 TaxID=1330021 RepID=A0A367LPM6_9HYPO|nr:hypothetical protein L249_2608 [Ophiocordyceps polyrhachis-furcata BCC 54312]